MYSAQLPTGGASGARPAAGEPVHGRTVEAHGRESLRLNWLTTGEKRIPNQDERKFRRWY
jgi:hypothetical protein